MTAGRRHFAALGAGAALLVSGGCGSSDERRKGEPLPQDAVAAIVQRLDEVQRRFDDGTSKGNRGACQDIENDSYKAIDATVEGLPEAVDPDVRKALEESLSRLQELTRKGCSKVKDTPPKQDTTPQETVPPPTVPQERVPERTDTQETVPDEKKPKKEKRDNGNDNGSGNGNGNGGQPGGTEVPGSNGGSQPAPPAEAE